MFIDIFSTYIYTFTDYIVFNNNNNNNKSIHVWHRLFVYFMFVDLVKNNYKAGRQTDDVDFQFTKQCFSLKVMSHISKIHFIITREIIDTQEYVVFITDTSSNGTFLNGEKIGKDCRWILSNNDKIAVVSKNNNGKLSDFHFIFINML